MAKQKVFTHDDLVSDIANMLGPVVREKADDEFTIEDLHAKTGRPLSTLRTNINRLVKTKQIENAGLVRSSSGTIIKAYRKVQNG